MAKKQEKVNKSQTVRDYKKKNPKSGPKEISEKLTAQGISVTAQFVSTVLSASGQTSAKYPVHSKKQIAPPKKSTIKNPQASTGEAKISRTAVIKVSKLAQELGGLDQLSSAVELLKTLKDLGVKL